MTLPSVADLLRPRPGYFYEPRVLWGMGLFTVVRGEDAPVVNIVLPERDSYYNEWRWPIILTDVITLEMSPQGRVSDGGSIVGQLPFELGSLGSARYSLGPVRGLLRPQPSGDAVEPLSPRNPDPVALTELGFTGDVTRSAIHYRSSLNTCRWDFQHALKLPPTASMELQLSGRPPTIVDTSAIRTSMDVNFFAGSPDQKAMWPQSTITRRETRLDQLTLDASRFYYSQAVQGSINVGEGGTPTAFVPPFGIGGAQQQLYPNHQTFTAVQANRQKANYNLPSHLTGFAVSFDQTELDAALYAADPTALVGPLSTTIYARARTRNGGTGNYWWRDGAPLAITTPTITPAVTHKLARPLAVGPGEGFKLTLPNLTPSALMGLPFSTTLGDDTQLYQSVFYLSFCGYALVEA